MDNELIQAVKAMAAGDEQGFNKVYSATYNHVYFRAKQYMKEEEDALDLVQIVYIEAYRCISSLENPEALFSWLDGITYRQGMKQFRKKKEVLLTEDEDGMFEQLESEDIETSPELSVEQQETCNIIKEIIDELPEPQKVAVVAFYFDNYSVGEIAQMSECSEGTIKSRLNYARKYIKNRVEEREKKEGYRLHVFVLPLLWYAIRQMAAEAAIPAETAQLVYSSACSHIGITASTITAGAATLAGTTGANALATTAATEATSGAVAMSAAGAATGVSTAGSIATTAASAAAKAGIAAKFAALSIAAKSLVIAGTVAVAGTVGTVAVVTINNNKEVVEPVIEVPQQDAAGAEKTEKDADANTSDRYEDISVSEPETTETQETPAISAFAAKTEFSYAEQEQIISAIIYMKNQMETGGFSTNYVFGARFYAESVVMWKDYQEGMLPLGWNDRIVVDEESVRAFWKDGYGITVPDDYGFADEMGEPFGGLITCDSELMWDWTTGFNRAKSVTVSDNGDGTFLITCEYDICDVFDPEWSEPGFCSAVAELSENPDVFFGYRILSVN